MARISSFLIFCTLLLMDVFGISCKQKENPSQNQSTKPTEIKTNKNTVGSSLDPFSCGDNDHPLFVLSITTKIHGILEPCGCTSNPLGDISRLVALLKRTAPCGLWLDAGGLGYGPEPLSAEKKQAAQWKADFLDKLLWDMGGISTLQPEDIKEGKTNIERFPANRVMSNVQGFLGLPTRILKEKAGIKVGILGLANPEENWPTEISVQEVQKVAEKEGRLLQKQGAQMIVALTGLNREQARRLAKAVPFLDMIVVGGDTNGEDGISMPEQVGSTLLLTPAKEVQKIMQVTFYLPPQLEQSKNLTNFQLPHQPQAQPELELAIKPETKPEAKPDKNLETKIKMNWILTPTQQKEKQELLQKKYQEAQNRLTDLQKHPDADPAFIKTLTEEVENRKQELTQLDKVLKPESGFMTAELIPLQTQFPKDPKIQQQISEINQKIGLLNVQQAKDPPPPAMTGQPSFVGLQGCQGTCHVHDQAVSFWQNTHHAQAWQTLEKDKKQFSYDCMSCHSTGFEKPGGSNLFSLAKPQKSYPNLQNVQCEACHGPGSFHAKDPSKQPMPIPIPGKEQCLSCHTKDHSDTFAFEAYLRDIVGVGHGQGRRQVLGEGITGHELRETALKKAGQHQ